jgi:uroporphyrin-III C-methyltransferase
MADTAVTFRTDRLLPHLHLREPTGISVRELERVDPDLPHCVAVVGAGRLGTALARALREAGVAVRVVPGVSAALAAPAAAGIPLMLRQLSVTLTVVDGNDDPEHGAPPDWEALARLGGTLVILTGRGRIRRIAAKLMDGGLAPDTPIAAISAASREAQQVLRGTLAALPAPLPPPVTFVVGAVAALDLTAPTLVTEAVGAHP